MIKARVKPQSKNSEEQIFEVNAKDNQIFLNDAPLNWDVISLKDKSFHIIKDHKSYLVEVVHQENKELTLSINNQLFQVSLQDQFDQLLNQLGIQAKSTKVENLKAPMPGLILNVLVEPGQEIKKGESLLILEAMKMENIIKAPGDAKVKSIKVEKGEKVEKNHVLIDFA